TDRAFRIGQRKNVFVYKMIADGTIEEKIDQMIADKEQLLEDVISSGKEAWITELSNREIMDLFRMD
ncbi:MAG TPA: ATP-dependent helicase, partial [Lachnospiraceae bacterium]|nr:ATP-dependent helicase [Lachnospiraceae bacterium]